LRNRDFLVPMGTVPQENNNLIRVKTRKFYIRHAHFYFRGRFLQGDAAWPARHGKFKTVTEEKKGI
jgi:hypothetical protein